MRMIGRGWTALLIGCSAFALLSPAPASQSPEARAATLQAFPELPLPPAVGDIKVVDTGPSGRRLYLDQLTREAETQGLPPDIADAVAFVESGYDSDARGAAGEFGLMQVLPTTAAMLGHTGGAIELLKPEVNIRYGVRYLAQAWRLTSGDLCRTLMKYRAGHGEERMSALSIQYCARARARLAHLGSPLANAPVPTEVAALPVAAGQVLAPARPGRSLGAVSQSAAVAGSLKRPRTALDSRRFWAAHEARIRIITARLAARTRKTAQN
jgi:Transglycosylase SLT domain